MGSNAEGSGMSGIWLPLRGKSISCGVGNYGSGRSWTDVYTLKVESDSRVYLNMTNTCSNRGTTGWIDVTGQTSWVPSWPSGYIWCVPAGTYMPGAVDKIDLITGLSVNEGGCTAAWPFN
jgi:hypothetical protein